MKLLLGLFCFLLFQSVPTDAQLTSASPISVWFNLRLLFLNSFNNFRSNPFPEAAAMKRLVWNLDLGELAQLDTQSCPAPDANINFTEIGNESDFPYSLIGHTLYTYGSNSTIKPYNAIYAAIQSWHSDFLNYDHTSHTCTAPDSSCDPFFQIMNDNATQVGCALSRCTYGNLSPFQSAIAIVCNFGEGYTQGGRPYVAGSPCAACNASKYRCVSKLCVARNPPAPESPPIENPPPTTAYSYNQTMVPPNDNATMPVYVSSNNTTNATTPASNATESTPVSNATEPATTLNATEPAPTLNATLVVTTTTQATTTANTTLPQAGVIGAQQGGATGSTTTIQPTLTFTFALVLLSSLLLNEFRG